MNRDRRGVLVVTAAALALLLPACTTAPKPQGKVQTWSYVETRLPPYWWAALVDVAGARARGAIGTERRIAILDTGVLPGHEDLANVSPGTATCGANSADTTDTNGHGTQLAGIAAGKDPGRATRGVAPAARLIPIKVSCGLVTADALTKGVDRAIAESRTSSSSRPAAIPPVRPTCRHSSRTASARIPLSSSWWHPSGMAPSTRGRNGRGSTMPSSSPR